MIYLVFLLTGVSGYFFIHYFLEMISVIRQKKPTFKENFWGNRRKLFGVRSPVSGETERSE